MNQYDYSSLVQTFEHYIEHQQQAGSPDSLYEPIRYINALGGKRIRPVLLLMAYNLWHEDVTPALPASLAIEYFHNFSLMHDDIMDEAPKRRGKESVHIRFGKNAAILSGDAMLIKCFDLLISLDNLRLTSLPVSGVMTKISLEICEGQQLDMDFEKLDSPTEEEYLDMIRKKTACLIGACLKIGALMAGASQEAASRLYSFGENIGLAFQIQDDILDVFGEEHLTGKQVGGDILQGKKNFLYVRMFNSLSGQQQIEFSAAYQLASSKGEIDKVMSMYTENRIEEYAMTIQKAFFNKAIECLDAFPELNTNILRTFAQHLLLRDR